jgi:hypothetical protein
VEFEHVLMGVREKNEKSANRMKPDSFLGHERERIEREQRKQVACHVIPCPPPGQAACEASGGVNRMKKPKTIGSRWMTGIEGKHAYETNIDKPNATP